MALARMGRDFAAQFQAEIKSGTVQRLLSDAEWQMPIFAVRPEGKRVSKKVTVLVDFLRSSLKTLPSNTIWSRVGRRPHNLSR